MLINTNYAQAIAQAKENNASFVDFEKVSPVTQTKNSDQDSVSISAKAQAMMEGKTVDEIAPIYVKPETARELLAQNASSENTEQVKESDTRFSEIMQSILDKRTGVDREKLKEIDAMMKDIGENPNLSAEEKQKALEELAKLKEKVIKESLEIQQTITSHMDTENEVI
ncbi:hypothetical protein ACOYR1_11280 [Thalassotalea piscium]